MAAQQFSVRAWLKSIDGSEYETNFLNHGYQSYDDVVTLTRDDLKAAGVAEDHLDYVYDRVNDLKAVSEDEAIRELSVSVLVYAWLIIVCL